ncbi:hypothetical protein Tco_0003871 [Tanacetum coccineum]
MLRRKVGEALRRKGCDDSFPRWSMLRRNPSGMLRRKLPWTIHFSAFHVQIPYLLLKCSLVALPSPDYVPGPEHPPSPNYLPGPEHPPLLVYVPEPEYPEYLVPSDAEAPMEDQPLSDALPIALSSGYVANSDLEENPEEDHADYPADGGDGDDESSDDDDDDDANDDDEEASEDKDDDKEEEEHLAPTPSPPLRVSSLPLTLPSPPTTSPTYAEAPLGYRAAGIRMRAASLLLSLPSTASKESLLYYSCFWIRGRGEFSTAARQPRPTLEADLRRDKVREMGYGITYTWDEIVEAMQEIAPNTLEGVNQRVTKLATIVRQDTYEFYVRFKDAQDDRAFLRARVNTLFRDRPYHRRTTMLLDREAMYARRACAGSKDRSAAIEAHVRILEAYVATLMAQTSSL